MEGLGLFYEPTSVQDIDRSPSPVGDQNFPATGLPLLPESPPETGDAHIHLDQQADDWNYMLDDFPFPHRSPLSLVPDDPSIDHLLDDPTSTDFYPDPELPWTIGFDAVNELIQAAECVDSNELQVAQGILSRLNLRMQSASGKPLQRAAFYFKEALYSLIMAGGTPFSFRRKVPSSLETVETIRTHRAFSCISPIPMFSHFTSTQALLEALEGSTYIHVIDFDIGFGGKWASFIKEAACPSKTPCPLVVLITAVVDEDFAGESRLVGDSLKQFASEAKIGFHIDFISARSFHLLSFQAIKFVDGERTAVYLTTATFPRFAGFLHNLRRFSPFVVVFVHDDRCCDDGFRRSFMNGLYYYSAILESLDSAGDGSTVEWVRRIEAMILKPRIFAAVEAAAVLSAAPWRETLAASGLRAVQLSPFADLQAECLLGKSHGGGFNVARHDREIVLCWHDRPLIATSVWN